MEGLTMPEMAIALKIDEGTVKMRLHRAGIKPLTTKALYPSSALDVIRNVPIKGQHRKNPVPADASKKPQKNKIRKSVQ